MRTFKLATSFLGRAKGMLGLNAWDGELLLVPCHDIHTFGMKHALDVAFINEDGVVVKAVRALQPGKRVRCKEACAVLERQADGARCWYEEGQCIAMCVQ